jgi:hypothetical protein
MTPIQVSSLGYDLSYSVPSTAEEYDQLAKEVGACVKSASLNVIYRSVLAELRPFFLHGVDKTDGIKNADGTDYLFDGLEVLTGIKRKTVPGKAKKDGTPGQEVWDETEDDFATRVWASLVAAGTFPSVEAARAAYATQAQDVLTHIVFDPSVQVRKSTGPKKVPKTFMAVAEIWATQAEGETPEVVQARLEAKAAVLSKLVGRTVAANTEDLGRAVWEDQTNKREQIAAQYQS